MSAYVHAALLLHEAKQQIDEENVKKVLKAAGVSIDEARVKALVAALSEVNIDEAIKTAPSIVAPTAAPAAPAPTPEKKEEKKKPPEEEKKTEEAAIQGLGALFGQFLLYPSPITKIGKESLFYLNLRFISPTVSTCENTNVFNALL